MGTILLCGLSADDADRRELGDNRQDEKEAVEVERSDRAEGWGTADGEHFDLFGKTATHRDTINKYKKVNCLSTKGLTRKCK